MPTFIGPEDDAIAVLHDAEDAQLDIGQVHPLTVHLQGEKPSQPTASFTTTHLEINRDLFSVASKSLGIAHYQG